MNIYAPNGDNHTFFIDLESALHSADEFPIIMGGDFSITQGSILVPKSKYLSVQVVKALCSSLEFMDIWRLLNPTGRDYTFSQM